VNDDRLTRTSFLLAAAAVLGGAVCALLVPWAAVHRELGGGGLAAVLVFLSLAGLGFVYAWRRGEADWDTTASRDADDSAPR
jgi:NADH:ubiquinone oxidoreductase subunit 3 (subunit A)